MIASAIGALSPVAIIAAILVAVVGVTVVMAALASTAGADGMPKPTEEQCSAMPEKWCDVVYDAQQSTRGRGVPVPWTVLAGIASAQTDFGRTSPYDTVDRYPTRPTPPYLAAHPGGLTVPGGLTPTGPVGSVAGLNAEQMSNAATIVNVGKQLGVPEYGQIIAVSTALQESTLVNLHYGDRDSQGLFQQRPSQGWGTVAQITTPSYAATKFYEVLVKVPGWQQMAVTVAAQKVQRSGFPSAYAKHEPVARALVAAVNAAGAGSAPAAPAGPAAGGAASGFTMPLDGAIKIVSGFGPRIHPALHTPMNHTGIDIMRPCGTPIKAAAAGVVSEASTSDSWGNRVKIEHAPGLVTAYGHQPNLIVHVGQRVAQGEVIGHVGTTGWSTGCHLHFDVIVNGSYVDPAPYLGLGKSGTGPALPAPVTSPAGTYKEKGGDGCQVAPPTTKIGGGDGEGSGPFLLNPVSADDLGQDQSQNPCESAKYVAGKLAQAAQSILNDGQVKPDEKNPAQSAKFWQQVMIRANIMVAPDASAAACSVPTVDGQDTPVDALIETIWRCELDKSAALYVVNDARVAPDGEVSFDVLDRDVATEQLIAEAKTASYNFSAWKTTGCVDTAPLAGIFPLTKQAAASKGTTDRCDVQGNIRAAAKAVADGESVPVAKRPVDTRQPFAPMIGGWDALPAALGKERTSFVLTGPIRDWNASTSCMDVIEAHLRKAARTGSPFGKLAAATAIPKDTSVYTSWLKASGPDPMSSPACSAPSSTALAGAAAELAGELASTPDIAPVAPAEAIPSDVKPSDAASPAPTPAGYDPVAMQGLGLWFAGHAQERTPSPAKFGTDSVIERLSTVPHSFTNGPATGRVQLPAAAWQSVATDWATFYGGFLPRDDTFGKRTGSLLRNTGQTVETSTSWGTASQQAQIVIAAAKKQLGVPYSWGGGTPNGPSRGFAQGANTIGFDCSSLVQYAYAAAGIKLPRTATPQSAFGTVVPNLAAAQPGDLLLFGGGGRYHHIGMYLGGGMMIHAPHTGDVVRIQKVYETPALIKHVLKDAPAAAAPAPAKAS